ncbi:DUF1257 domain-containing protein [Mariniblastus fucicola]|uniref:DUF1257 domain-containing protein n=1 Tax=Mariniblastus fucicola TaxID=980251 RepID=UPI001EE48A06|nr:DUF1257 domain-containing protein [Mariniblastus fucicola]
MKIETQIRDINAVRHACRRLRLEPPNHGTFELYNSTETGWGVRFRDWKYPVVCKVESGEVAYDNYEGRWGDPNRLGEFFQSYAVEKAAIEARLQGYSSTEQLLEDGSIKLIIETGEGGYV